MADKKSFLMYTSYQEQLALLSDEECGRLMRALIAYADDHTILPLDGATAMAFAFIRAQMDRDEEAYEERCAKNRENGMRGGRPKKGNSESEETERLQEKPNKTERFLEKPKKPDNDNDDDNDDDDEDDNDDEDDIITPPTPSKGGKAKKVDPFVEFAGGDAEMAEALSGFEEMRKKMRKPMTDRAKTLLLAKLEKLSPDRAGQIALLDEATAKNWLSVYDGSDYNRVSHAPPGSKGDEWDRLIASYGGYDGGGEIIDITEHG